MDNNRLHIRRFHTQYLVSSDNHWAPERVRARIDEAMTRRQLAQTLSTIFSSWFSEGDPSVWLIRRLEIDIAVNAATVREHLTRSITRQIARTLGAVLQGAEDSENVMRFPNRAAHLARFLLDLADGAAWDKWYYESFAGLRLLPTSVALRTAICDQPVDGQEALLRLTDDELKKMLRALSVQDARRILDGLTENGIEGDHFRCCQAAWAAWRMIEADLHIASDEWRQTLHLYLAATRDGPNAGGPTLRGASRALVKLARKVKAKSASQIQELVSALTGGEMPALSEIAGATDAEVLLPLLHCPPEWVREVTQGLVAPASEQQSVEFEANVGRRHTAFGGAFLLLPLLDEFPLAEATRDWPHADEAAAISLVRLLLLVKCRDGERAERAFYDPLLRDLLLIPPAVSPETIRRWQSSITAIQLQSFLLTIINWQRSHGGVRDEKQILAGTTSRGRPAVALIDSARGLWLLACRYSRRQPQRLIARLRGLLPELQRRDGVLHCAPSLLATLSNEFPQLKMESLKDKAGQSTSQGDNHLTGMLARLDKLAGDLSHLALPDSLIPSHAFDLAFSVVAQHLMRAFAWRLPGFAGSNLPYLFHNFLDVAGSIEHEPARRIVRLGRPPLHLVLGMTGTTRQIYRLSWLDERPLALFQET
jgi:hypothetical protein